MISCFPSDYIFWNYFFMFNKKLKSFKSLIFFFSLKDLLKALKPLKQMYSKI